MRIALVIDYNNITWIGKQNYQVYCSLNSLWIKTDIINLVSPQWFKNTPDYWINIISKYFIFWSFFYFKKELRKLLKINDYDLILYWHQWLAYLHNTTKWLRTVELINVFDLFTLYNEYTPIWDFRFKIYNIFFLRKVVNFKNIVFDSNFAKKDFDRFFSLQDKSTRVIPIWFNKNNITKIEEPKNLSNFNWKKIVLHVWSEDRRKNIHAFYWVALNFSKREDILFVRIWKKSKESEIRMESWLYPNVQYYNNLSEEQLNWFYANANVFLYTSYHEWFWMPFVEAYSHWVPIVSTKISDMAELFANDPNILFVNDADNYIEYSSKLIEFLDWNKEYIKQETFPIHDTIWEAKMYLEFFEEIINK